ncbi:MAG TPA: bifunctional nuclease family protein [Acidimicrobiales bacterium]|nr:bifunctional nuclease family protein [Acidimicrobiales bacterium]
MRPVQILGVHVEATSGTPLILLREDDSPQRVLPIFVGPMEAAAIAVALDGQAPPRPLTHDVMAELLLSLDGRVDRVEVTGLRDGTFVAELAVTGPGGERRLDARPSDAIALALRVGAPTFVSDEVLDQAGTALVEELDQEAIDAEVTEFRSLLEGLSPADLASDPGSPPAGPPAHPATDERDAEGP